MTKQAIPPFHTAAATPAVTATPTTPTEPRPRNSRTGTEPVWTVEDSIDLYNVRGWGKGFFDVNDQGHVVVLPTKTPGAAIDLHSVVEGLRERGLKTPVLVHFSDLLEKRLNDIHEAFAGAIKEHNYKGDYVGVYPIKVNQQRRVVEEVRQYGMKLGFGLEVGSKPELLAVLGMTSDTPERLIICNGFKEARYIEFITLAAKLGRTIIPVIENLTELKLIVEYAQRYQIRPRIGVRVNLSTPGAGRWRHSSGAKAKFGLSFSEVLGVLEYLRARGMEDCFELLHCHMGSQIHEVRQVNAGVNELVRTYVQLVKLGAGMKYLDVGGGLGIDYDGSQTSFEFSTNYTLPEYAATVVYRAMSVCDEEGVPHPTIVTESGRAMVAQQSVLIFDTITADRPDRTRVPAELPALKAGEEELPRPLLELFDTYKTVSERRLIEQYHDASEARDEASRLFSLGYMNLEHRALCDVIYWATCAKIRDKCREAEETPEELEDLESLLSDTYFGNLSIFQSLPDIWAIRQLFPILPIHRLNEKPTRKATIADITCDSDGRVDRFVDDRDVKKFVELHEFDENESYYIGAFLVGAYQETLGDLHNLFGDTHVAHVKYDGSGNWWIDEIIEGDAVRDVLSYVHYDVNTLLAQVRRECEKAVRLKQMTATESQSLVRIYESGINGYTYLEREIPSIEG